MTPSSLLAARRASRGFTLIELMIAVTIGLVLTIVVASLFLHSRATYGNTDDLSRMQENIRYTHQLLTRVIHHASYMTSPNSAKDIDSADPKAAPVVVFDAVNAALTATEGIGLLSDSFTVRFQGSGNGAGTPDGTVADCQGREIDAKQFAVNTFTIAVGANGRNALFCDNGVANREVVADVENMQLLFAEDTSSPRDGSAERYVPFGGVTTFNNVVAVRVALLFQTPNIAATVVTEPNRTYDLNGVVLGPFLDKRIRRVVATTINLRNRTR